MKLTIPQEPLARALKLAARIAPQKPTLPILGNVLFNAKDDGTLWLESTNLETSLQQRLSAEVERPGKVALPAAFLAGLMSQYDKGAITAEMNDKLTVTFSSGPAEAPIAGVDADEWPQVPVIDGDTLLELPFAALHQAIDQTVFCASTDDNRAILNGVSMRIGHETIVLEAIDGFRFGIVELPYGVNAGSPVNLIIPAAVLQLLPNLFDDTDTVTIRVSKNGNRVAFSTAYTTLSSRLIDGEFPSIVRHIPKGEAGTITISRLALLNVAKTAAVFGTGESDWLQLTVEGQKLLCQTRDYGTKKYATRLPVEIIEPMPTGVDPIFRGQIGYFVQTLQAMTANTVLFHLRGQRQLLMINEPENEQAQWAIMPLTIK